MTDFPRRDFRIMAVDDEPANLMLLGKILTKGGYAEPIMINDPRQAVESYLRRKPDLILLDINMPHLDGIAVMEKLQALNDPLLPPIVVLTAQIGREYLLRAFEQGARDYLTKPFDTVELLARVRNLLAAHLAHKMIHDQKSALESMVRQRTEEIRRTRLQVVQRLGRAAEFRDNETGLHIVRMSKIAVILARAAGWDEAKCDLLFHAAPMHDIGKIGIPDAILLKPGKLTPEEFEIIKTHTTIGAKILEGDESDLLGMAHEIVLGHHEKWDGTGYPYGRKGNDIPMTGRIVALADVFDALTSVRPYKRAWTLEEATSHIQESAGRHFDPDLVALFMSKIQDIDEIRITHAEPAN